MGFSVTPLVNVDYSVQNAYGSTVTVAGLPVALYVDANGFFITAAFQNVFILGSPVIAYFDPPVATIDEVSLPGLLQFLVDALLRGAVIG